MREEVSKAWEAGRSVWWGGGSVAIKLGGSCRRLGSESSGSPLKKGSAKPFRKMKKMTAPAVF